MAVTYIPSAARTFLAILLAISNPAWATESSDLSVALKTLPLLTAQIASPATVAIIYDPANPASEADAQKMRSILESELQAPGDVKLIVRMVGTTGLSGLAGAAIAFLANGISPQDYDAIATAAAGALTICTDLPCVEANKCVLGIVSRPRVEVYYSPSAAEKSKVHFVSAFTMLAKQVGAM
ncbi:MAG: hypothetical protein P4M15_05210 [Alphaproteobacteria bacterium]|nr:hypothetical protein [Alphaproteobacteria bacterium]